MGGWLTLPHRGVGHPRAESKSGTPIEHTGHSRAEERFGIPGRVRLHGLSTVAPMGGALTILLTPRPMGKFRRCRRRLGPRALSCRLLQTLAQ